MYEYRSKYAVLTIMHFLLLWYINLTLLNLNFILPVSSKIYVEIPLSNLFVSTLFCRPKHLSRTYFQVRLREVKKSSRDKVNFSKMKKKCLHKVGLLKQFNDMSSPSQKKKNMTDLNRGESERRSKLPFLIISIFHSLVSDANNCDRVRNECSLTS